jgi:hypothetical protein
MMSGLGVSGGNRTEPGGLRTSRVFSVDRAVSVHFRDCDGSRWLIPRCWEWPTDNAVGRSPAGGLARVSASAPPYIPNLATFDEPQTRAIEGVATALTPIAFFETVMVRRYENLVDSDTRVVDVNTGIVAAGRPQSLIDSRNRSRELLG